MPTLVEVLGELAETFATTVSEVQAEAYATALVDCTEEEIMRAAGAWLRTERWMPRPADLRGLVVLDRNQRLRERKIEQARQQHAAALEAKASRPAPKPRELLSVRFARLKALGLSSDELVARIDDE